MKKFNQPITEEEINEFTKDFHGLNDTPGISIPEVFTEEEKAWEEFMFDQMLLNRENNFYL